MLAAEVFANGKTYKLSPTASERAAGKYDCSSFVQAVLKKEGFNVGGSTGNKINIVLSEADKSKLKELVEASDKKIKGVVSALVESNQGSEISSIMNLRAGDIIQLWRISGGTPKGHTAIVKSINAETKKVMLVGAHNPTDGVGEKEFVLNETGWPIWFGVRPSK